MKTIIIPANCSSTYIQLFKLAICLFKDEEIDCRFLEIRALPDNYNDLVTLPKTRAQHISFDATCSESIRTLIRQYNRKISFHVDHVYGDSPAVFRNYAHHHQADLVIYDKQEWQDSKKKKGLNVFRMVSRSNCELMYVSQGVVMEHEPSLPAMNYPKNQQEEAPSSLLYQFNAVDAQLNDLHQSIYNNMILSKRVNHLSRYFLNESLVQKMLTRSECPLLLLTK